MPKAPDLETSDQYSRKAEERLQRHGQRIIVVTADKLIGDTEKIRMRMTHRNSMSCAANHADVVFTVTAYSGL